MKKFLKILTITACVIIFLAMTFTIYLFQAVNNNTKYSSALSANKDQSTLEITENRSIKILQLTDLQFANFIEAGLSFGIAKNTIKKAKPDLIVLTGDNVTNNSKKEHAELLVKFLDSFEIPWALVYGNHDYNSSVPAGELAEIYEQSRNGIFKRGTVANSYGNYYYNLTKDNKPIFSLLFMDSKQDGFTQDHVDWYQTQINQITASNSNQVVPSFVFFHIPTKETEIAWQQYKNQTISGSGWQYENVCYQSTDVGFFQKAVDLASTKALIYGHDHVNNTTLDYQGIKLCYGLKSGRTCYYRPGMLGGNLYTINLDGSFDINRIYTFL